MTRIWRIASVAMLSASACDASVGDRGPDRSDAETLAVGRSIYVKHCATCHGSAGEGAAGWQEMNAAGEMPAPPHDSTGHTWRHSDAVLYRIIERGWRDPFNRTQRLTMPAFGDSLAPEQIRPVIGYLKTLWTAKQRRFQVEESRGEPFPETSVAAELERNHARRTGESDSTTLGGSENEQKSTTESEEAAHADRIAVRSAGPSLSTIARACCRCVRTSRGLHEVHNKWVS